MPYTVGKVYERSNPIPMVDTQDPDIAKLQAIGDKSFPMRSNRIGF